MNYDSFEMQFEITVLINRLIYLLYLAAFCLTFQVVKEQVIRLSMKQHRIAKTVCSDVWNSGMVKKLNLANIH